jgi:hypothetical protein
MKIDKSLRVFTKNNAHARLDFANEFVTEFVRDLAPPRGKDEPSDWTPRIADKFKQICPIDCDATPNKKEGWKEHLVDFAWMEQKGLGGRVLLACESEWASDRFGKQTSWPLVEDDFEKLLAIKAPFKVIIFSSDRTSQEPNKNPNVNFRIEHAMEHVKASLVGYSHHLAGETYILLDFPATGVKDGDGEFYAYVWIVENDGPSKVQFEDLANGKLNRR